MVLLERKGSEGGRGYSERKGKQNRGLYLTLPLGKLKGVCLIELRSNSEIFINGLNE